MWGNRACEYAGGGEGGQGVVDAGADAGYQFFCVAGPEPAAEAGVCGSAGVWVREDFEVDLGGLGGVYRSLSGDPLDAEAVRVPGGLECAGAGERRQLFDWLRGAGREFVVVATKIDRLSGNERTRNLLALKKGLESGRGAAGFSEDWVWGWGVVGAD